MWATRESSAVRIGVRRAGELGYEWKGVDRVARMVENEGLKASKARVSKRPARRAHGGRHVVEGCSILFWGLPSRRFTDPEYAGTRHATPRREHQSTIPHPRLPGYSVRNWAVNITNTLINDMKIRSIPSNPEPSGRQSLLSYSDIHPGSRSRRRVTMTAHPLRI